MRKTPHRAVKRPPSAVRRLRKARNLTQQEAADAANLSLETYRRIESGETEDPHQHTVEKIAGAFKIDVAELTSALATRQNGFAEEGARYDAGYYDDDENGLKPQLPEDLDRYCADYRECEVLFAKLAKKNADCEKALFDALYIELNGARWIKRRGQLAAAKKLILDNLVDTLNAVRDLFKILHKVDCAVCVQLHVFEKHPGQEKTSVRTVCRDDVSVLARGAHEIDNEPHELQENTISFRIFVAKKPYVIINGLRAAMNCGRISTTSRLAGEFYDAVFVARVPVVNDGAESVSSLCVDTMNAFDVSRLAVSKHFVSELAWRVAVMLYRLEVIKEELLILTQRK